MTRGIHPSMIVSVVFRDLGSSESCLLSSCLLSKQTISRHGRRVIEHQQHSPGVCSSQVYNGALQVVHISNQWCMSVDTLVDCEGHVCRIAALVGNMLFQEFGWGGQGATVVSDGKLQVPFDVDNLMVRL